MARPSSFNREDALESARNLFWRKGFHATSLKDIEAALSLRPGSIYAAFGSKKNLFAEALEYYTTGVEEEFRTYLAQAETPISGLIAYVRSITLPRDRDLPSNACMIFKTALELADDESDLKQLARNQLACVTRLFIEAFERARQSGEVPDTLDPRRAALKLQSGITGLRGMIESGLTQADAINLNDDIIAEVERMRSQQ